MKKTARSIFSIILSLLLLITAIPLANVGNLTFKASAAEEVTVDGITYIISNGEAEVYDCDTTLSGEITIPDKVNDYPVTSIYRGFFCCTSLTSITLPNSVTNIGDYAFYGCTSLASIIIPNSVTNIGDYAFTGCSSLTSITIPNSVTNIGHYAFSDCTSLTSIAIPNSVTSFGYYAFGRCTSLTTVTISAGSTIIGAYAFVECTSLINITIPDSVISIDGFAFYDCTSLAKITLLNPDVQIYDSQNTIPDYITIYGYDNSTAQEYAEKYGNEFVSLREDVPHTHTYTEVITKTATCKEEGITTFTCDCGDSYTEPIPVIAHKYTESVTKTATCKEEGIKTFTCGCGDSYTEPIPVLTKHSFGAWAVTKAATYEADGLEERSCGVCGKKESRAIVKLTYTEVTFDTNDSLKLLGTENVVTLPETTVKTLMENAKGNVYITDKGGKEVSGDAPVTSGMTVTLKDSDGKVLDTKTVVVPGDNDGDGSVSSADARTALRAAVKIETLNSWQTAASDVEEMEKKEISSADARYILRAAVGLESFNKWMSSVK